MEHFLTTIKKRRKKVGRGDKTAGRGTKGQKSRKSGQVRIGFEGGQNPFYLRFPKKETKSKKKKIKVINLKSLENNKVSNSEIDLSNKKKKIKILGEGTITKQIKLKANFISNKAKEKLLKAGGSYEEKK